MQVQVLFPAFFSNERLTAILPSRLIVNEHRKTADLATDFGLDCARVVMPLASRNSGRNRPYVSAARSHGGERLAACSGLKKLARFVDLFAAHIQMGDQPNTVGAERQSQHAAQF